MVRERLERSPCKFLMRDPEAWVCARFTELHIMLVERPMNAKFVPSTPDCQQERVSVTPND